MRHIVYRYIGAFGVLLALAACGSMEGIRPFWTLSEADFREIKPGMTQEDVEKRVGKPLWRLAFPQRSEEVWSYDYLDYHTHMRSVMHFDTRGVLKRTTLEYDMDYYSTESN
jgi:outer membrane protein assembly factor BamE (lipoprotein component of BamABCDE complex)